jgi:hypothetical protein
MTAARFSRSGLRVSALAIEESDRKLQFYSLV